MCCLLSTSVRQLSGKRKWPLRLTSHLWERINFLFGSIITCDKCDFSSRDEIVRDITQDRLEPFQSKSTIFLTFFWIVCHNGKSPKSLPFMIAIEMRFIFGIQIKTTRAKCTFKSALKLSKKCLPNSFFALNFFTLWE